ncbi:uncharacterized protein LOC9630271 [Selaginella moellendorffii]|nr:uncharacterized protein LOC9630271 [Selaginella moellendorffii]|eukprot:XP_002987691.2 uncharacterized protein LOC9630271 [Selaginella moellendorffii]
MALVMAMAPCQGLGGATTLRFRPISTPPSKRGMATIVMAVPKKRTSKTKRKIRHAVWMRKARVAADKALSLAKSVLTGRSNSFYYETDDQPPAETPKCFGDGYGLTEEGMLDEEEEDMLEEARFNARAVVVGMNFLNLLAAARLAGRTRL